MLYLSLSLDFRPVGVLPSLSVLGDLSLWSAAAFMLVYLIHSWWSSYKPGSMAFAYHHLCASLLSVHSLRVVTNVQCNGQPASQTTGESQAQCLEFKQV